ncbi:MAG: hypothetical protein MN733_02815, partial [Nitrososphaera sp.]|nr:hypothetical protein [Nitrososphaera sp.]
GIGLGVRKSRIKRWLKTWSVNDHLKVPKAKRNVTWRVRQSGYMKKPLGTVLEEGPEQSLVQWDYLEKPQCVTNQSIVDIEESDD